jgi:RNA polymerase sigma-70 factor, ECF subfamily
VTRPDRNIAQWLSEARAGSIEALAQLVDSYREYLLLIARRELGADLQVKQSPSDLVQETWATAQKQFGAFRGNTEAELRAWLRRLLLTKVDYVRRYWRDIEKRRIGLERGLAPAASPESKDLELTDKAPSPCDEAIQEETLGALQQALARLPDDYRLVIQLRLRENRPFKEIACVMTRSKDAVQKLFARAIERLREDMEPFR